MKDTYLKLTKATSSKLLEILNDVPEHHRDVKWRELFNDVKNVCDIWNNIDLRNYHMAKIRAQIKKNSKTHQIYSK